MQSKISLPSIDIRRGKKGKRRTVLSAQPLRRVGMATGRVVASASFRKRVDEGEEDEPVIAGFNNNLSSSEGNISQTKNDYFWEPRQSFLSAATEQVNKSISDALYHAASPKPSVSRKSGYIPPVLEKRKSFEDDLSYLLSALQSLKYARKPAPTSAGRLLRNWKEQDSANLDNKQVASIDLMRKISRQDVLLLRLEDDVTMDILESHCKRFITSSSSVYLTILCGCIVARAVDDAAILRRVFMLEKESLQYNIHKMRTKILTEAATGAAVMLILAIGEQSAFQTKSSAEAAVSAASVIMCLQQIDIRLEFEELQQQITVTSCTFVVLTAVIVLHANDLHPADVFLNHTETIQPPVRRRQRSATISASTRRTSSSRAMQTNKKHKSGCGRSASLVKFRDKRGIELRRIREMKRVERIELWERTIASMDIQTLKLYVASLNGQFRPEHYTALLRLSEEDSVVRPVASEEQLSSCLKNRAALPSDSSEQCVICMQQFSEGEPLSIFPNCCHIFHSDCLSEYLLNYNKNCPLCKGSLEGETDDDQQESTVPLTAEA